MAPSLEIVVTTAVTDGFPLDASMAASCRLVLGEVLALTRTVLLSEDMVPEDADEACGGSVVLVELVASVWSVDEVDGVVCAGGPGICFPGAGEELGSTGGSVCWGSGGGGPVFTKWQMTRMHA